VAGVARGRPQRGGQAVGGGSEEEGQPAAGMVRARQESGSLTAGQFRGKFLGRRKSLPAGCVLVVELFFGLPRLTRPAP